MFVQTIEMWKPESVSDFLETEDFYEIAKETYKDDFKDYCDDLDEADKKLLTSQDKSIRELRERELLCDFLTDGNIDEGECFETLVEEYAKKHNHKATFCDWRRDEYDDYYTIILLQIIPTTKEELLEMAELYLKSVSGEEQLAEVVVDKLISSI